MNKRIIIRKQIKSAFEMLLFLITATGAALLVNMGGVGKESLILLYLLAVLFTTVSTRSYIYGVISAVSGVMLFNYFFTEPVRTLLISSSTDITLVAFFFLTAIVAGSIMSRLQKQTDIANQNEKTAKLLYEINGGFLHVTGEESIALKGIGYIFEHSGCIAVIGLVSGRCYHDENYALPEADEYTRDYPIDGAAARLGRMRIFGVTARTLETHELLFKTVTAQLGIAFDREYIYKEREEIRIAMEREKLRSALLRAVAHDLRSPLTALSGSSSVLAEHFDSLTKGEQKELAKNISEEMIWLTNLVENILNMTRINEDQLVLYKEYEVVDDVVGEATSHMKNLLAERAFNVILPDSVIAINMDGKLIAQVLINLLENAVKHTRKTAAITLEVSIRGKNVDFSVKDTGDGVPKQMDDSIFESYVSAERGSSDGKRGMGLGLAICKAVVEAHGGIIWVEDNIPHGACFVFSLPMED